MELTGGSPDARTPRMKRVFVYLGIVLAFVIIGFYSIGFFSPVSFHGSLTRELSVPADRVWEFLHNPGARRRPEITAIEILEKDATGPRTWKEKTDMGGYIVFKRTDEPDARIMRLEMVESSFGMSGTWTYEISGKEMSRLTITEDSMIRNAAVRASMTLSGRDANLRREFEMIGRAEIAPLRY